MWMQLGTPADSMLPPRFERLYQPERIAQFDRFFARGKLLSSAGSVKIPLLESGADSLRVNIGWATPVRRSHQAQHTKGSSDDDVGSREFRRSVSAHHDSLDRNIPSNNNNCDQRVTLTLDSFVNNYGLQPHFKPTLKGFVNHHEIKGTKKNESLKTSGSVGLLGMFASAFVGLWWPVDSCV
jgi:hypothetical protein